MRISDSEDKREPSKGGWYLILLAGLLAIGIAAVAVIFRERLADFRHYGYLGAFLISILASATVIAFIPSVPVIFTLGGVLNPFFVALTAGMGEGIGEFTSYLAGRGGYVLFKGRSMSIHPWLQRWVKTKGSFALFLSSAVFNPFFSVIGATAGVLRFPPWKFFLIVWAGKTVKWTVVAVLGQLVLVHVLHWFGITL